MHKLNPPRSFLLALIVLATCSFAFGQETTGSIEGFVKDPAGALVPNVTLTITNAKASAILMTRVFSASCRFLREPMMWSRRQPADLAKHDTKT